MEGWDEYGQILEQRAVGVDGWQLIMERR